MAFETLMARFNLLLQGAQHDSPDTYTLLDELHLELNQLKASGQPLPEDLVRFEKQLTAELESRRPKE